MLILEQHLTNSPARQTGQRKPVPTRCVHCFQPLLAMRNASLRGRNRDGHTCQESQLAKLPAAPVPFN